MDLQDDAGFQNANGVLTSMWAKALFDMAQFVLMDDPRVREMQQYLNQNYYTYTGILPTDGIFQRATNEAIVFGLQAELGLSPDVATGYFGNQTQNLYRTAYQSGIGNYPRIVILLQFSLYANMQEYYDQLGGINLAFNGILDVNTVNIISTFQGFMRLDPVADGMPDLRTVLSLIQSNGDWTRTFWGVDTSMQLDARAVTSLMEFEARYVGRYLTGTVGANFVPKYLTRDEALNIFNGFMRIIPIYQDNIYIPNASYYTYEQGKSDARKAMFAAASIGIPEGNFIYFAVDFDALDYEIVGSVIPYFNGVQEIMLGNEYPFQYQSGIYGTRNVCTQVSRATGVKNSYVANMSSGWSGNLGFSQPLNWAFDQFYEYNFQGIPIDFVAVSHLDEGFSTLVPPMIGSNYWLDQTDWEWLRLLLYNNEIKWDGEPYVVQDFGIIEMEVSLHYSVQTVNDSPLTLDILNGELTVDSKNMVEDLFGVKVGGEFITRANEFIVGISVGQISFSPVFDNSGRVGAKLIVNFSDFESQLAHVGSSVEIGIYFDPNLSSGSLILDTVLGKIGDYIEENIGKIIVVAMIAFVVWVLWQLGTAAAILSALAGLFTLVLGIFEDDDDNNDAGEE